MRFPIHKHAVLRQAEIIDAVIAHVLADPEIDHNGNEIAEAIGCNPATIFENIGGINTALLQRGTGVRLARRNRSTFYIQNR